MFTLALVPGAPESYISLYAATNTTVSDAGGCDARGGVPGGGPTGRGGVLCSEGAIDRA